MRPFPALERATHPLTLAAAGLVALNDFVLRPLWPGSWWSGKLSTLGAAFCLPLLLAVLLGGLFPRRRKAAGVLAFALTLAGLVLLKASPLSNGWLTGWLPLRAVADPGDLLAVLPWLAALLFFLRPLPPRAARAPGRPRYALLAVAAFFLLADAAAPDYGAACLGVKDDALIARAGYSVYISIDGGRSWILTELPSPEACYTPGMAGPREFESANGTRYRVTPGVSVERAAPGATEWETVYTVSRPSEPEEVYLRRIVSSSILFQTPPLAAEIAPRTNNLVLAMGTEGILVVPPSGAVEWVSIDDYRRHSLRAAGAAGYVGILAGELWLAGAATLLAFATFLLRSRKTAWLTGLLVLGWLWFLIVWAAHHPDFNSGYLMAVVSVALMGLLILALALVITGLIRQRGSSLRPPARRLLLLPAIFALFILPYAAWAAQLLPQYWIAQALALVLSALLAWRLR